MKTIRLVEIAVLLSFVAPSLLFNQEASTASQDTAGALLKPGRPFFDVDFSERKVIGLVLSTVIPGSGQSYLGHQTKGALFTLGTLGSALVAGLSENNVLGRNERLDELKTQYSLAVRYEDADIFWKKMQETKEILDRNRRQRDRFVTIAAVLWVANIVDVLLFTDDRGEKTFGALQNFPATLTITPDLQNGVNAVVCVRF